MHRIRCEIVSSVCLISLVHCHMSPLTYSLLDYNISGRIVLCMNPIVNDLIHDMLCSCVYIKLIIYSCIIYAIFNDVLVHTAGCYCHHIVIAKYQRYFLPHFCQYKYCQQYLH